MSYDLFTFRLPAGADPSDYATEVVESFEEEFELDPSAPTVAQLVASFRAVFPQVEVPEEDEDSAVLLLEDRLVSIDAWRSHTEVCVSYGIPKDSAWLAGLLTGIARAARDAGHDTLFDAQLDRPIDPAGSADVAEIGAAYDEGLAIVAQLSAQHAAEPKGGGFFKRLFGR